MRSKLARTVVGGLLVACLSLAGLLVGVGTASAKPSGCSSHKDSFTDGSAHCTGGTGQVRVVLYCRDNFSGTRSTQYGNWVNVPSGTSRGQCYPGQRSELLSTGYQTR